MLGNTAVSREQIFAALYDRVSEAKFATPIMGSTTWVGKARKYVDPAQIGPDMQPFLAQHEGYPERYTYQAAGRVNLPPTRLLGIRLWCWARVDSGDVQQLGSLYLTTMMEAIEQALAPDVPALDFRCTLGGLVERVRIEGTVIRIPGDTDQQALLLVPIVALWPN